MVSPNINSIARIMLALGIATISLQISAAPSEPAPPFILEWGSVGTANGEFNRPRGIAVDNSGNVYVSDRQNNRIQKFDSSGTFLMQWGSPGNGAGQFNFPDGIAIDASDNIFVADWFNARVQKFDSSGNFLIEFGSVGSGNGEFSSLVGVATDLAGNVYTADFGNDRIQKFDNNGGYLTQWGTPGTGNGQFGVVHDVAVDSNNNVFVVEWSNHRIQKFDSNGNFILRWGANDGDGSSGSAEGEFSFPRGLDVGTDGAVYVTDTGNHRVQKFDNNGVFLTEWGVSGDGAGQFDVLWRIAIDRTLIYVTDEIDNHRIQKFGFDPISVSEITLKMVETTYGNGPNSDKFNIKGQFILDSYSDGIDPVLEEVSFSVGTAGFDIPAGNFVEKKSGTYNFNDTVDGSRISATFKEKDLVTYKFEITAKDIDLTNTSNPIDVQLNVGDDTGVETVRLKGKLRIR